LQRNYFVTFLLNSFRWAIAVPALYVCQNYYCSGLALLPQNFSLESPNPPVGFRRQVCCQSICKQKGVVCPMSEPQNAIIRVEHSYLQENIEVGQDKGREKHVGYTFGCSQHLSEQESGDQRVRFLL